MRQYSVYGAQQYDSSRVLGRRTLGRPWIRVAMTLSICLLSPLAPAGPEDLVLGYAVALIGDDCQSRSIAVDGSGNTYLTGHFRGAVDFDPGPGTFVITNTGFDNIFICKLDAGGSLVWAVSMVSGGGNDQGFGIAVDADAAGDVYLTGRFSGIADFDPGPGTFNLNSSAGSVFVCKLSSSGIFQWARAMGGSGEGTGISLDNAGNVYVAGHFRGGSEYGPFDFASVGDWDIFVCKLNSSGTFQWARQIGSSGGEQCWDLDADSLGNLYFTGRFGGAVDFDPGPGISNLSIPGASGTYVCKLNTSGIFQWARGMGGGAGSYADGSSIVVSGSGGVCFTGRYNGTIDFLSGPGTSDLTSAGGDDIFVCKLDLAGGFQWARGLGGSGVDEGHAIAVDGMGNVFATGDFEGVADLDPGTGVLNATSAGSFGVFLLKLDASGDLQWAGTVGGANYITSGGLASGADENVYVTGSFQSIVDFDPGDAIFNLTMPGSGGYIMRLETQLFPLATDDSGETDADQLLWVLTNPASDSVLTNDTDLNTRRTLSVVTDNTVSILGADVALNPDGTFVYDPTGVAAFQALAPNDSINDSFTYTISDGTDTAVGTVTITVNGKGARLPAATGWGLTAMTLGLALVGAGVLSRGQRLS